MKSPIRVLVVDDSPTQLALMVGLLRADSDFEVVGTSADGRAAVAAATKLRPSVVAMDIHLPIIDGYEATRQIMQNCPTPIVLFSGVSGDTGVRSMQALAAGALAVAASTGGPAALKTFLEGLGPNFPLPILIVQHIARGFSTALREWLASVIPQPLDFARADGRLTPGHAYLAPDDHHLILGAPGMASVIPTVSADRNSPSADRLFESTARWYGPRAIGVIMTGMGDDGTRGMGAMRAAGALTLGQDEASCVVFGMPRAAYEAGAVARLLPLEGLAGAVLAAATPPSASLQRGAQ